jgi:putative two-component system response regulator
MGKQAILVIDDDITTLTAMRKMLENHFEVSLAKSAETAWSILNNTLIDLILLDVEMPVMSGLDFMKFLQESASFCYMPVIFVTSHGTPDVIMKAMGTGAKSFIVKPVAPDVLLEKINAVLKDAGPKNVRDSLLRRLHLLEIACKAGKSADVEKLIGELAKMHYNEGTDTLVIEICKNALNLNYTVAVEKIGALIKSNLFEMK